MVRQSVKKKKPTGQPVQRTYTSGKKLFGKHAGSFVFRPKAKANKADQLKLKL